MHAHRHKARNDDNCRQDEENLLFAQEIDYLCLFCTAIEFLIADTHRIKCVQDQLGYNQRSKQGNDDTECQGLGKALDGTGTHKVQYNSCDQRRYVAVDNRGQCFLKTNLNRRFYSFASCDFFPDSGKNNDVCIDRHTDRQDDTCDTGQGQGNIKAIQQQNNQHRVNAQCDGACNTGNPVNSDHENNNNRKTNCTGNQARTDRCRSELCAYYVGTQLLQLQLQTADTDGRSEVFRLFKGAHAIDDCLTVCDFCLYRRCADHLIVINDVNNIMVRICCLCRISELFGSICSHSQRYNRLLIIHAIGLIGCLCICYIRTA